MKKSIVFLCTVMALLACAKETPMTEVPFQQENEEIKVNLTITRSDNSDTKATVKTEWEEGDVVFIVFRGVGAPKYLEMKYKNDNTWASTAMEGLVADDLSSASTKKMTAVYLPYGSDYSVASDEDGNWTIKKDGENYKGHFYSGSNDYTFKGGVLSGKIALSAFHPTGDTQGEGTMLVHFDITGFDKTHVYELNQDYMKAMQLKRIASSDIHIPQSGSVTALTHDRTIPGYYDKDNNIISFSGLLDASAVNVDVTYRFVIHDRTAHKAYYRSVGPKKISNNKYIGLGDISDSEIWTEISAPYFSVSPTKLVTFASGNLYKSKVDGKYYFHTNQYDYTYGTVTAQIYDDGTEMESDDTKDRDLFTWTELNTADFGTISGETGWRMLSHTESIYLINTRPTKYGKYVRIRLSHGKGFPDYTWMDQENFVSKTCDGVQGWFFFPDSWDNTLNTETIATYLNNNSSLKDSPYEMTMFPVDSDITAGKYSALISGGAIFLPLCGRFDPTVKFKSVGEDGNYWLGNQYADSKGYRWHVYISKVSGSDSADKGNYMPVRLVRDLN